MLLELESQDAVRQSFLSYQFVNKKEKKQTLGVQKFLHKKNAMASLPRFERDQHLYTFSIQLSMPTLI